VTDNERHPDGEPANTAAELDDTHLDEVAGGLPAVQAPASHTLGIGSQSTGAGAGKITFNPFSI
jgi:hypothetical protein